MIFFVLGDCPVTEKVCKKKNAANDPILISYHLTHNLFSKDISGSFSFECWKVVILYLSFEMLISYK